MFDAVTFLESLLAEPSADAEPVAARPSPAEPEPGIRPDDLPGDWRVWFEERAAIREFDGGQAREHAEAEALRETLAAMRQAGDI